MTKSRKLIIAICFVFGVTFLGTAGIVVLRVYFIGFIVVPQDGMYPTIPAGGYALTRKAPYDEVIEVKRGDIVVFTRTVNGRDYKFAWRVIGLPGDRIEVSGEAVMINGKTLQRANVRNEGSMSIYSETNDAVSYEVAYNSSIETNKSPDVASTVPQNQLFVMGDNRQNALDSTHYGPIPFESVIEKVILE